MRWLASLVVLLIVGSANSVYSIDKSLMAADVIRIPDAHGEGSTAEEALKNAFTDAVQRAVGVYTRASEKLTVSGDAVQEIATYSNGYIVWYEKLDLKDDGDGKKRVLIACDVSRSKTVARLEKAGVRIAQSDSGKVDGKALFAEEVSKERESDEATRLLTQVLLRVPSTKDMLQGAELLPRKLQPKKNEDQFPRSPGYFCEVFFRLKYDYEMLTQYCSWVDKTLQHAGFTDRYEKSVSHRYANTPDGVFWEEQVLLNSELGRQEYSTFLDLHRVIKSRDDSQGALVLLTHFEHDDAMDVNNVFKDGKAFDGKPHIRTKWVVYKLNRRVLQQVERDVYRNAHQTEISFADGYKAYRNLKPLETEVAVQFLGPQGKAVAVEKKTYREIRNFYLDHFFDQPVNLDDNGNALMVSFISLSPTISFINPNKYASVNLKRSDLEAIEKVDVKIVK